MSLCNKLNVALKTKVYDYRCSGEPTRCCPGQGKVSERPPLSKVAKRHERLWAEVFFPLSSVSLAVTESWQWLACRCPFQ